MVSKYSCTGMHYYFNGQLSVLGVHNNNILCALATFYNTQFMQYNIMYIASSDLINEP